MKPESCSVVEADLVAAAAGEASPSSVARVRGHLAGCLPCREMHAQYRTLGGIVEEIRAAPAADEVEALDRLRARIADVRSRILRYVVFSSRVGPLLLAASELGIAWIEYLDESGVAGSAIHGRKALELRPDESLRPFERELSEYLAGRRSGLDWSLDLRLAGSDFQRTVLAAASRIPYGAVSSYAGIARDLGKPAAVRAVAQALRRNPVPILIPCHRIVGSDGALVGYAGNRIGLKERLLGVEGVQIAHRRSRAAVDRGSMYAWDPAGREYCLPTCGDVSERPIGAVTLFATGRDAVRAGLVPCRACRPDRNALPRRVASPERESPGDAGAFRGVGRGGVEPPTR
jgi:methylated-DNA-[protein]-cysteine S-methyltransferase